MVIPSQLIDSILPFISLAALLVKVTTGGGIFSNKEIERIKWLKRVSFIIYSNENDFCTISIISVKKVRHEFWVKYCTKKREMLVMKLFTCSSFRLKRICKRINNVEDEMKPIDNKLTNTHYSVFTQDFS